MAVLHKKFGSSTARRTLNCSAWTNIKTPDLPDTDSPDAARGTMLHDIMEAIFDQDADQKAVTADLSDDDNLAIESAIAATDEILDDYNVHSYECEQFMDLPGRDDVGGTPDMLAWGEEWFINLDYKFGRVEVSNWDQHLFGLMCAASDPRYAKHMEGKRFLAVIIQPAVSSHPITEEITRDELDTFTRDYKAALDRAGTGTTTGYPGDWCKYCDAAPWCEVKRSQVGDFLSYDPAQQTELAQGMDIIKQMKEHIRAVEAAAFDCLEHGKPVPGWKLVLKQGRRRWIDADKAWHKLRHSGKKGMNKDLYVVETLNTAPKVTAALKKAGFDIDMSDFITNASTGTTIAPESDKRAAVEGGAGSVPSALDNILDK